MNTIIINHMIISQIPGFLPKSFKFVIRDDSQIGIKINMTSVVRLKLNP